MKTIVPNLLLGAGFVLTAFAIALSVLKASEDNGNQNEGLMIAFGLIGIVAMLLGVIIEWIFKERSDL